MTHTDGETNKGNSKKVKSHSKKIYNLRRSEYSGAITLPRQLRWKKNYRGSTGDAEPRTLQTKIRFKRPGN